jgi:hypothetical protein
MKKILLIVLIFLTLLNIVKFEIYTILNPSLLLEQTSTDTLLSAIDINLTMCKARGLNSTKEIGKLLYSINLCPFLNIKTGSNTDLQTATNHFPLDPNPDSGQMNIHLRI